jgi:hypothetical protein
VLGVRSSLKMQSGYIIVKSVDVPQKLKYFLPEECKRVL